MRSQAPRARIEPNPTRKRIRVILHPAPMWRARGALGRAAFSAAGVLTTQFAFAQGAAPERPIVEAIATAPDACYDGNSLAQSIATWLNKKTIDSRISILVRRPTEA